MRELEFGHAAATKFQRKKIPDSDQVAVIREDLRCDGLFEERILAERVTGIFLVLSLFPEELRSFTVRRIVLPLMKSLAKSGEMK
jgi:hypothetical protein